MVHTFLKNIHIHYNEINCEWFTADEEWFLNTEVLIIFFAVSNISYYFAVLDLNSKIEIEWNEQQNVNYLTSVSERGAPFLTLVVRNQINFTELIYVHCTATITI